MDGSATTGSRGCAGSPGWGARARVWQGGSELGDAAQGPVCPVGPGGQLCLERAIAEGVCWSVTPQLHGIRVHIT